MSTNARLVILCLAFFSICSFVTLVAALIVNQQLLPSPKPNWQLELQNLILASCTDCRPSEIVYQQGSNGIVAEFQRRDSVCPHVVIGSRFATLGVKQVVIAQIDGRNQQLPVGTVFQSCLIKWQVQFSGG